MSCNSMFHDIIFYDSLIYKFRCDDPGHYLTY